jgi:putative salt-induced outer membrane protein YdiY
VQKLYLAVLTVTLASSPLLADTVELVTGDLLHGTVVEQTEQVVVFNHPVLGRVVLPLDKVQAVMITAKQADAAPPLTTPHEQAVQAPPATATPNIDDSQTLSQKLLPGWDKHFELGFNGSDGNSQTFTLRSAFKATREDDHKRWNLDATYYRNEDDGNRTRNEFTGEVTRDWLMPDSPWFKFASSKFEYDEFQDWESRVSGFAGVGNVILDTPRHNLIGKAGLGGSYPFGTVNELVPETLLGLEWIYQINDRQKLESYVTVFPSLDEFGESRTLAGTAWSIQIDEADGISLKFGIENEYESRTEGTAKHNDAKYYGALVFDF